MNFEDYVMHLKALAAEAYVGALIPKDESVLRDGFDCGWSPEMALDDLIQQSQYGNDQ